MRTGTGGKRKKKKQSKADIERKRRNRNFAWILAGCILVFGLAGFFAGRYWLYPSYEASKGDSYSTESGSDADAENQELQELNRQIDEADDAE